MEPLLDVPDASEDSGDLVLARHEREAGQNVPYHPSMRPDEFKKGVLPARKAPDVITAEAWEKDHKNFLVEDVLH